MTPNIRNLRPNSRDHFSCQARQTDGKGTIRSLDHFWKQTKFFSKNNTSKDIAIKTLNIVNVSKLSIINFRLEENSRADRRAHEPGARLSKDPVQCVAQFPAGTSFRPKKSKLGFFRWDFNSSSTEAIRQKNKHICYQLIVLVGFLIEKRVNKKGFYSGK